MHGDIEPMEEQFDKQIWAKKERVAQNELKRLRNLTLAHKMQMPSSVGLCSTGHQRKKELGLGPASGQGLHRFSGMFPGESPQREDAPGLREEEEVSVPL